MRAIIIKHAGLINAGEILDDRSIMIVTLRRSLGMLLSGIRRRQLFTGITILSLSPLLEAAALSASKAEPIILTAKPRIESSVHAPVMESGTRIFAEENNKNEFYILGKYERDPVKKGGILVNTQPLEAGIDSSSILNVKPQDEDVDPIMEAVKQEEAEAAKEQTVSENQQGFFGDAAVPVGEQFNESTIAMQPKENEMKKDLPHDEQEAKESTNLNKVKKILHSMTRKIAVKNKKKYSKVHVAAKHRKVSGKRIAKAKRTWHVAAKHAHKHAKHIA
jgi:hypothetical protein